MRTFIWGTGRLAQVMLSVLESCRLVNQSFDEGWFNDPVFMVHDSYLPEPQGKEGERDWDHEKFRYFSLPAAGSWIYNRVYALEGLQKAEKVYIPIGYRNLNKDREKVYNELLSKGWVIKSFYHPSSRFEGKHDVGNIVFSDCRLQVGSTIGKGNLFYDGVHLGHHSTVGDFNYFTTGSVCCGGVTIKNNCFIGACATICPDVTINDRCIVGAGAVISKDLPPDSVAIAGLNNIIDKKSWEINLR